METNYETWSTQKLVAKIYDLEATVQSLKEVTSDNMVLSIKDKFRLTMSQARLLTALSDGRPHSKRAIYEFVYHDEFNNPPEMKVIDVFMSHVRKKIHPFGMSVQTLHGAGYKLNNHETVAKVIAGETVAVDVPAVEGGLKRRSGENARSVLKVLIAEMDSNGKTRIMARVLARAAELKVPLLPIMKGLEASGAIQVKVRPTKKDRDVPWVVFVKARALND